MGMYDSLECKMSLPLPKNLGEVHNVNFNNLIYQTKDLDNCLDYYKIRKNGTLCRLDITSTWVKRDGNKVEVIKKRWKNVKFTGTIEFYDSLQYSVVANAKWENDYHIKFAAKVVNGVVKKITRTSFEVVSAIARKEYIANFNKKMKEVEIRWNRWYMKYGYRHYDTFIKFIVRQTYIITGYRIPYKLEKFFRPL